MLMDQIIQAKQGSQADMLSLLQQFQPILKKYGRKLWGEDGLEDMTAAFLQVIHDMKPEQIRCRAEGAVVQYLVQSVRHAYERLQRERMRQPAIAFSLNEMEEQDSQNGRLVGAVTHVLVNDPTRGYGIFAQTMLEQAKNAVQNGAEAQTAE